MRTLFSVCKKNGKLCDFTTMCKGCQYCLESCYWHLIEKRFCYDESIALYEDPVKEIEKHPNAFENVAFYDQVALIAGRSIVTIDPLPKKPKPIAHQPKPTLRWWEDNVDEQNKVNENKKEDNPIQVHTDVKVSEIDQKPKEEPKPLNANLLYVGEIKLRKKSLAERRHSRSLTLHIDRTLELPIIRQSSMPKFYIDTPDVTQTDPQAFREPASVLISPLSVKNLSDPFDLRSVVQMEKDNRLNNFVPIHKQPPAAFSRLSVIKEKLKTSKLKKQASTSNLPHSIQHI